MNNISFISVNSAINEYLKQCDPDDEIDRTRLKSFANSTARQFSIANIQAVKVASFKISNFGVALPDDFDDVVQILYRVKPKSSLKRYEVVEWAQKCFGTDCKLKITKECPSCHMSETCNCGIPSVILQADVNWRELHGYERYSHSKFYKEGRVIGEGGGKKKSNDWEILHRTTNNFNNLKSDLNNDCRYPDTTERGEYDIRDRRLITSFKSGEILMSYLGNELDDDGYYMIPNHPDAINAVVYSIMASDALRMYTKTQTQSTRVYWSDMTQLADLTLKKAISKLNFTPYDVLKATLKKNWNQVITGHFSEYNLGKARRDQYQPEKWTK